MTFSKLIRDAGLDAVIGMYPVVHRLRSTVVNPWIAAGRGEIGVNPPRRVLLYGVPGSGVRFIAHRLSDELVDSANIGSIVLEQLDEKFESDPDETLTLLGGPATNDIVTIGVSYRPWDLPLETFRSRGFDRLAFVPPPDWDARRFRLWESPIGGQVDSSALDRLVAATEGWAGSDLSSIGDWRIDAADSAVSVEQLVDMVSQAIPQSSAWFTSVRELIPKMDSYGRVDDLVGYLQRYRLL